MGVWSSISFRNFEKEKIKNTCSSHPRNSTMKQILNIDSDSFSATILQDVQEIRIQESDQFENSVHSHSQKEESLDCPTYFEYSMGGNLKFYKEHLQQDFEMENHVYSTKNQRQRLRKSSHSDNDSEPEALRYAHKAQEKVVPAVNTISEEPELSFDDYSSIYQPEFMLNINSKSLVKEMPKHGLGENKERAKDKEIEDKVKNNEHKIASWSQNCVGDSSPDNVVENLEVLIISKQNNQPAVKQNIVSKSHEQMFDYHSPLVTTKRNGKQLENKALEPVNDKSKRMKSVENKSRGNQGTMSVKRDQNKTKNKMANLKPRQPKTIQSSTESNVAVKTISSSDNPSLKRKKIVNNMTPPLLKKTENKKESKDGSKKATERRKTSKNLIPKKESNSDVSRFCEDPLPCAANNQRSVKPQENFLSMLNIDTTTMFDNTDLFEELEMTTEKMLSEPKRNKDAEFYPESPISELHFFKTPCSTRHNSLETFEQLESECIEGCVQEEEKPQENTKNLPLNYERLPKEFQEMARRLSKKDFPKKSLPSSNQVNSFQNFNCSSSTCSTMSPHSPSGRTLFRTPSYKMPKTPSLSRQHPSTYVTQHTSSRSRSSSRVSSRAASPTREHIEALL